MVMLNFEFVMAKNGPKGGGRKGAVRGRSQIGNPLTSLWQKRNAASGRFMDNKSTGGRFKGVRRER
jgi:hypothetical protein